jgi:hypothetical protein
MTTGMASAASVLKLNYIIDCSPMKDMYGNHFILLSKHFIRCFYKNIINTDFNVVNESNMGNYMDKFSKDLRFVSYEVDLNSKEPDPLFDDLKTCLLNTYSMTKIKPQMFILRKSINGGVKKFDLNSAIGRLMDLIKEDPDNKYLYPLRDTKIRVNSTDTMIFSFLDNFKEDKETIVSIKNGTMNKPNAYGGFEEVEEENPSDIKPTPRPKENVAAKIIKNVEKFEKKAAKYYENMSKKENPKELLDNVTKMVDNIDSISIGKELVNLADHIFEVLEDKGINVVKLSKYYKKKAMMIDDSCGYPIVKDLDDIPSPFPEDVEGDITLANL